MIAVCDVAFHSDLDMMRGQIGDSVVASAVVVLVVVVVVVLVQYKSGLGLLVVRGAPASCMPNNTVIYGAC